MKHYKETPLINYAILQDATEFYKERGYQEISVPWIVSNEAIDVTRPKHKKPFNIHTVDSERLPLHVFNKGYFGSLVASAEQSFIQLLLDNKLPPGKYVATTPCFRDEKIDTYHQNYFMKVELFQSVNKNHPQYKKQQQMESILQDAYEFHRKYFDIRTEEINRYQKDLVTNDERNLELGSYGIRFYKNFCWAYGTGVAQPRFSQAHIQGYHKETIPKSQYGTLDKIREEILEAKDAEKQDVKLMTLLELADTIGAIEGYLEKKAPGISIDDLIAMKNVTKRAFEAGKR